MSSEAFFAKTAAGSTVTVRFGDDQGTTKPPRYALAYWSIRGLAAPLRMMLSAAKVDHTVFMYDLVEDGEHGWKSDYFEEKPKLIDEHRCALMNLPYVVDRQEERVICQTNACKSYLGRELGMFGKDKAEQSKCDELLCEIYDVRNIMIKFAYVSAGTADDAKAALSQASSHFGKLNTYLKFAAEDLKTDSVNHLVGGTFSAPDFHLFEMLDQFSNLCKRYDLPDFLDKYENLRAFKSGFEQLEENKFYLSSWLHTGLPFNNCMAKFGSAPGGAVYKRGQTADWRGKGEVSLTP